MSCRKVAISSFLQRLCPRPLLGRMNASIRFVVWGAMPIGSLVGGALGQELGVRPVLWTAFAGSALAATFVVFSPLITMRDLPGGLEGGRAPRSDVRRDR